MPQIVKPANRLLAALPKEEYQRLLPNFSRIALPFKEIIYNPGDVIRDVYFPESGIISLLSAVEKHSTLEVGIIGNEGMIGLPVFMGVGKSATQALVQGEGFALKMKTANFLAECRSGSSALPRILQRFTHSLMTQISQSAVCNRFHAIEERLARWLLMTSDRMKAAEFRITQEFLSNMLGVRREAVTLSAQKLQQRKLISYSRGLVKILDRKTLESDACACYALIRNEEASFPAKLKKN